MRLLCLVGLIAAAAQPAAARPLPSFPEPLDTEAKALNALSELLDDHLDLLDWQKAKVAEMRQRCQSSLHGDRLVRCLVRISMSLCAHAFIINYPRVCWSVSPSFRPWRCRWAYALSECETDQDKRG